MQRCGISSYKPFRDFKLWIKATKRRTSRSQVGFSRSRSLPLLTKIAIHGAPFVQWDGVAGDGLTGYCPHGSNVFLTWHRPYLALFEQVLQRKAIEIATEYPAGNAQKNALSVAGRVRLPYWDWALNPENNTKGVMPASLRSQSATVTFPNGTSGEIPNPLFAYSFHPLKYEDFSALVSRLDSTRRYSLWEEI